ncbi:MAG: CDC27 family protein [Sulfurimonas sp.]|nr:CDC27 family protein [Sulfurimonas sp.]
MLNIIDLEKRWFKYKIKSYIPHLSIFISIIIIIFIFFSFSSTSQVLPQENKEVPKTLPIIKEVTKIKKISPPILTKTIIEVEPIATIDKSQVNTPSSKKVVLSPSLDFMRKMQNSIQPYYKNESSTKQNVQKVQAPIVEVVEHPQVITPKYIEEVNVKHISIKRQNRQNDIYEIIARFKKNNNPALSLFVAKKYYELKDYQQAYNYALITNKINKEIESSWIIFAKALVKMGKRDKAISTLKSYIKQSHSSSARILLDEIYSGKFR